LFAQAHSHHPIPIFKCRRWPVNVRRLRWPKTSLEFPTKSKYKIGSAHLSIIKDQPHTPADALIDVIQTSVQPQTWTMRNGHGTICEYDGLLVVNATNAVQSDVADLLNKLSSRLKSRAAILNRRQQFSK
jgi:hypothetical protein